MSNNKYIKKEEQKFSQKKRKRFRFPKREGRSASSQNLVQIMNGEFLTKEFFINNMAYIFFVFLLLIVILWKGYYVNQLNADIRKMEETLGQISADYVEAKAKLEEETRRTMLIEKLEPLGLVETINPTKVIRKSNSNKK